MQNLPEAAELGQGVGGRTSVHRGCHDVTLPCTLLDQLLQEAACLPLWCWVHAGLLHSQVTGQGLGHQGRLWGLAQRGQAAWASLGESDVLPSGVAKEGMIPCLTAVVVKFNRVP